jgi:hypothetical protein
VQRRLEANLLAWSRKDRKSFLFEISSSGLKYKKKEKVTKNQRKNEVSEDAR